MRVKDFIKKTITKLTLKFDNIKVSYRYDVIGETHYVEILPNEFFNNSEELTLIRADIYDEFDETYPTQSIVFISEHSLAKIGSAEFSMEGKSYNTANCVELKWFKQISDSLKRDASPILTGESDNNYALAA